MDTGTRIKGKLDAVVAKIEGVTQEVETTLEDVTNETVSKLARVKQKYHGMFKATNDVLDEMIGGHNEFPLGNDEKPL